MKFLTFLLVAVVVKASAQPQPSASFRFNDLNNFNSGAYGPSLPVINTHIQTAVVENPTVNFPSYNPSGSTAESCHCMRTLVRPQLRNEFITVPAVDRILRTVSTPIVETFDCGGATRLTTFTPTNTLSGVTDRRNLSEDNQKKNTQRALNESNRGKGFTPSQGTNPQNGASSTLSFNLVPRTSVYTFQPLIENNLQRLSNPFIKNPAFSNEGLNGC